MTKQEFISELRDKLSRFPKQEVEERLDFYSEMIDDRIEDGLTEEAAISDLGTSDEIAAQIINDIVFTVSLLLMRRKHLKKEQKFLMMDKLLFAQFVE